MKSYFYMPQRDLVAYPYHQFSFIQGGDGGMNARNPPNNGRIEACRA